VRGQAPQGREGRHSPGTGGRQGGCRGAAREAEVGDWDVRSGARQGGGQWWREERAACPEPPASGASSYGCLPATICRQDQALYGHIHLRMKSISIHPSHFKTSQLLRVSLIRQ